MNLITVLLKLYLCLQKSIFGCNLVCSSGKLPRNMTEEPFRPEISLFFF